MAGMGGKRIDPRMTAARYDAAGLGCEAVAVMATFSGMIYGGLLE